MIELPEAASLAAQLNHTVTGKRITGVTATHTPHKLAWYYGEPSRYHELLMGREIGNASAYGGLVEIRAGNVNILFSDGVNLRFHARNEPRPLKHQLLLEFEDLTALSASVQMYGGAGCFPAGGLENKYYAAAKSKPSPLSSEFSPDYFRRIVSSPGAGKLSLKALLATEQRIPGLGNGVLQDILFVAKLHPKRKVNTLANEDKELLFSSLKSVLSDMAARGGRDTELSLFGKPGDYKTMLSKNTLNNPCPVCGTSISKEAYLGGSIYYCARCQRL
jgi:formamidopyrimidine-DNA glycosylase